jgi:hypothetical protein
VDEDTALSSRKRIISCKWVYKLKRNADSSCRFKARLVIQGFEQEYGIDYTETFALVVKFVTICILFALAAKYNWEIEQMDVVTAFLNLLLQEEVYIELPKGYILPDGSLPRTSGGKVICRLQKCLYGLKQAPQAWYTDINVYLTDTLGFTCSEEDYNLYI